LIPLNFVKWHRAGPSYPDFLAPRARVARRVAGAEQLVFVADDCRATPRLRPPACGSFWSAWGKTISQTPGSVTTALHGFVEALNARFWNVTCTMPVWVGKQWQPQLDCFSRRPS